MADLIFETFNGTTLPSGWAEFTDTGGTTDHSSTSTSSLTATTTAGSKARLRSPSVTMAVGDTLTAKLTGIAPFVTMLVLRMDTGSTAFMPCILANGANWAAQRYRDATGYGSIAGSSTNRDTSTHPWVRFRCVSSTEIAMEAAPDSSGLPGTWVIIGTADATNDALTMSLSTTQIELLAHDVYGGFGGTTTVDQVGTGTSPTISSIAPTSGPIGTEVTMTGTNLTGATGVTHGPTVAMTGLVVDNSTQARATIASGSPASGTIRITTPGGVGTGPTFTITPIFTSLQITNPNTSYTIGALLSPITVRALDQFGNTFLGTVPADGSTPAGHCAASSLTLPVGVTGTLIEPFVSGIATFDDLTAALISSTLRDLLAGRRAAHWCRIMVKDAAGTFRDLRDIGGQDYQVSAVVTRDQEAPAATATVTVRSGRGLGSVQPGMSLATQNLTGRLLDVGREFQVWTCLTEVGTVPGTGDFDLIHHGRVDTINAADINMIRLTGRDLSVRILDGVFGSTQTYGTAGGVAIQTVLQSMLDTVLGSGAVTLNTPVSPAWLITNTPVYTVPIGTSLYAAMRQLVDQIGWRLTYNYPGDVATLQLLGPNRAAALADWTLAASEIRAVNDVTFSLEPVRNSVTVQYTDASFVVQTPVVATSSGSISAYGFRPMVVKESASSQIRTSTQAQRMADAIRDDLSLPLLTKELTHQHGFYPILPGHVIDVLPNGVHFDATTRLAVARTVLTLENGGGSMTMALRGAPASRGRGWLDLGGPSLVDTNTVTPTMIVTPISIPTNGGTAALHTEFVVTGLNPAGGALPVLRVYFDAAYLTVQRWTGSAWTGLSDGEAITTGTSVRALRPPFGREVQRITFTATLSGGGVDRVVLTVPNRDPVAPAVIATQTASTSTSKTYRITTTIGGLQVRWTGGSATKTAGPALNVYGTEPQDYTFDRPAPLGPDADALFECVAGTGAGAISDADSVTVPAIGRDTVPMLTRARIIATTASTYTVRVSASAAFNARNGVITLTQLQGVTALLGASARVEGDTDFATITMVDGDITTELASVPAYRDYIVSRPAFAAAPGRASFRVAGRFAEDLDASPDSDSVDIQPQDFQPIYRVIAVAAVQSGAVITQRFRMFDATGVSRTFTDTANIAVLVTETPSVGSITQTTIAVSYDAGNDWLHYSITRTAGSGYLSVIQIQPSFGCSRTDAVMPLPSYMPPGTAGTTPRFASVNVVNTGTSSTAGNLNVVYTGENLPSGGSYRLSVDNSTFISAGVFTGTGSSFTVLSAGAYTDGTAPPSGKSADRARGTLEMLDSSGVTVVSVPLPYNEFFGVI
jgi:hypothetical protein